MSDPRSWIVEEATTANGAFLPILVPLPAAPVRAARRQCHPSRYLRQCDESCGRPAVALT
jgi:hypothetical protein